jgi:hypothetical protein
LSKGEFDETAWHMEARRDHVELLEKLWESTKELQLKPEELRMNVVVERLVWISDLEKGTKKGHFELSEKLWDWAKNCSLNQTS